jgi:hypothetical protein
MGQALLLRVSSWNINQQKQRLDPFFCPKCEAHKPTTKAVALFTGKCLTNCSRYNPDALKRGFMLSSEAEKRVMRCNRRKVGFAAIGVRFIGKY